MATCENCDRVECPKLTGVVPAEIKQAWVAATAAMDAAESVWRRSDHRPAAGAAYEAAREQFERAYDVRWNWTDEDCHAHRVNWRERALAAEVDLDTARAYATKHRADADELRAEVARLTVELADATKPRWDSGGELRSGDTVLARLSRGVRAVHWQVMAAPHVCGAVAHKQGRLMAAIAEAKTAAEAAAGVKDGE